MILCRSDTFFRKLLRSSRERVCINDIKRCTLVFQDRNICVLHVNMNSHGIITGKNLARCCIDLNGTGTAFVIYNKIIIDRAGREGKHADRLNR